MSFVIWGIKFLLLISVFAILRSFVSVDRLRRSSGFEAAFLFTTLPSCYGALLAVETLNYLPKVGAALAAVPIYPLLKRFDVHSPGNSLCGFLLVEGTISLGVSALYLLIFGLLLNVDRRRRLARVTFLVVAWIVVVFGYKYLAKKSGLPQPDETDFSVFYLAVAERINWASTLNWQNPALTVAGTFLLLGALATMLNLSWRVSRNDQIGFRFNNLRPFERHKARSILYAFSYFILIWGGLKLTALLMKSWMPDWTHLHTATAPTLAMLLRPGIEISVVALITFLCVYFSGPESLENSLDWRWGHLRDYGLGLIWSLITVVFIVLVGRSLGWWQVSGIRQPEALQLLLYAAVMLLNAFGNVLMFQGYILQKLNTSFSFLTSAILSSALCALCFIGYLHLTWLGYLVLFLIGLFHCYLFQLSRSLWLPIGFNAGWNFWLGSVFAFPVVGLATDRLQITHMGDALNFTGASWGPGGGILSLIAFLLGLLIIQVFVRLDRVSEF